jgi:hypothetical protein
MGRNLDCFDVFFSFSTLIELPDDKTLNCKNTKKMFMTFQTGGESLRQEIGECWLRTVELRNKSLHPKKRTESEIPSKNRARCQFP